MTARTAATKEDIIPGCKHLRVSPNLPLETQLHILQGRLTGLEDADMAPNRVRSLRAETLERLKIVRLSLARENAAKLNTLELPCRDQYR
jgi:hypothetical protein